VQRPVSPLASTRRPMASQRGLLRTFFQYVIVCKLVSSQYIDYELVMVVVAVGVLRSGFGARRSTFSVRRSALDVRLSAFSVA